MRDYDEQQQHHHKYMAQLSVAFAFVYIVFGSFHRWSLFRFEYGRYGLRPVESVCVCACTDDDGYSHDSC